MLDQPIIVSINISKGGIPKLPIDEVRITTRGLEGDGHNHEKHYRLDQAVCIQDIEMLNQLTVEGYPIKAGDAGENLTVRGLNVNSLSVGSILNFANGVVLEITRVRPTCYVMDQINSKLKEDATGRHGMYARVLKEGILTTGEIIKVIKPLPLTWAYHTSAIFCGTSYYLHS